MALFDPGKVIKTDFGAPIKIVKYLASGGQGDVYIAEYGGKQKALKWYKKHPGAAFKKNLADNICRILEEHELEQRLCKEAKESISLFDNAILCDKWKTLFEEIETGTQNISKDEDITT